ncbi:MAG: transcription-repair coupling factor [Proteobacteria bacterium]|nr:transcription-repair coupling factor [Pseudomonadota bacterium]
MLTSGFNIEAAGLATLHGAPFGHHARLLSELASRARPRTVLYVAADDMAAAVTETLVRFFSKNAEILSFPAWDCLPYDRVGPSASVIAQRVETLCRLQETPKVPRVVITTAHAVIQKVPPQGAFTGHAFALAKGQVLDLAKFKSFLAHNGYARVETVREAGEFAMRGSLIDVFPSGAELPLRLDLFGDQVESIRSFDPLSQRTVAPQDSANFLPVSEILLDDAAIARFRSGWREHFGVGAGDPLYESVSEGRKYPGMEHWLPLYYPQLAPVTAFMERAVIVVDAAVFETLKARRAQIEDFYAARVALAKSERKSGQPIYRPLPPDMLYLPLAEWEKTLAAHASAQLSPFPPPEGGLDAGGRRARDFADLRARSDINLFEAVHDAIADERKNRPVLFACYSEGSAHRLQHVLNDHGLSNIEDVKDFSALSTRGASVTGLAVLGLEHGFASNDLLVFSEQDILGDRLSRPKPRRGKTDEFSLELSQLAEGDLVVHAEHGIGRYMGLETLDVGRAAHDCLRIMYDGNAKLFVPVENLEVLSRYGSHSETVALDRLGSAAWQGRKSRVKKRLKDMADALLKIAAERLLHDAERIVAPAGTYDEFAARFPYAETEDQERAIGNVFDDLASGKPMDRLICGDAGFGKTEVAIRAAFATVQSGLQVALVVPTTLLARQHFRNFAARFHGLPVQLAQLSRLVAPKEAKEIKEGLKEGKMDIVVGTHALLGKEISFKNLGLLIVDEEQHFGVKQKERLKQLRADVHVLTLTATPIPRTLQLAVAGVRELSLITTPPVDRLSVRSFVLPYDGLVIREALMREHYRGGQSFYVCPRIEDLDGLRAKLAELVPELKIATAHGQLSPSALEEVMEAFDEARFDVLLCTHIVESGLDIPNANTIVIHRADMFGLAQLYQLRGRVGRAKQRGYAYLTYDPVKPLTPAAQQRLEVLSTLEGLGAGFQLASHDLDIRGAGNLLGEEQSGQIREVGIELYQQMLEDAIHAARIGESEAVQAQDKWTPQINLGMAVLIPETYVSDLGLRLNLYRRLAALEDRAAIESFAAELIDRFGALPPEVQNLLEIVAIKQLCRAAGIERLDAGPQGAVLTLRNNTFAKPEKLVGYIQKNAALVKVRPDQKIGFTRSFDDAPARLKGVRKILDDLIMLSK